MDDGQEGMTAVSLEQIVEFLTKRRDLVHLLTLANRPGSRALFGCIEWYWYSPRSERNRFFHIHMVEWEDMEWIVASFPTGRYAAAKRLATKLGMRIADGIPTVLRALQPGETPRPLPGLSPGVTAVAFPGSLLPDGRDNPLVFTVESDKESPIFHNRRSVDAEIIHMELEIINAFIQGATLTPHQVADYIYGPTADRFGT